MGMGSEANPVGAVNRDNTRKNANNRIPFMVLFPFIAVLLSEV
jgi:hypothetical protein